ncbi:glycosyltransferase family 4 protein [Patescibacteria group bacterium]|nr:glycosyltransferase family 4 protein [Patescibacteria group bacterium]
MIKKKALIIHSIPTPYRLPMFVKLAQSENIDLTVLFMGKGAKNRIWDIQVSNKLNYRFLNGWTINLHQDDDVYPIWINPSIVWEILRSDYDVVIATGWDSLTTFLARITCYLKQTPFILWAGSTKNEASRRRQLTNWPVKILVNSAHALIAYGTAARDYLVSLGVRENKIVISFNTVDVDFYHQQLIRLRKKNIQAINNFASRKKITILFVGQLIHRKGVQTLLNAVIKLKSHKNIRLIWVGYGRLQERLATIGNKNGVEQSFFTAKTPEEMSQFYSMADIFVLPSYEEVWGLVLNEAMASGLPVISTDKVGGSYDLIQQGVNGYIVPVHNSLQLADKLSLLIKNKNLRAKMSLESRRIIKKFNYSQNVDAFLQTINMVT